MFKYMLPFMIIGCGRQQKQIENDFIRHDAPFESNFEKELEPYVKRFELEVGVSASEVSTFFVKIDDAVGKCYSYPTGERKIDIDRDYWNSATEYEKENLMYHELGHCALNLDHNVILIELEKSSIPESIMYPYIFGADWNYKAFRNYYVRELKYAR